MKSKPDDRRDNARKIKQAIDSTKHNMEMAEEIIARTSNPKAKEDLEAKNKRRAQAIEPMEAEMREESRNR